MNLVTELKVTLDGTTIEEIVLYGQKGHINKIVYPGHQTGRENILQLKKPISESLYIKGIREKFSKEFGDSIDIKIKDPNRKNKPKMKTIEDIQMTSDEFGGTNVVDGAGFISNGVYAMTQKEITKMVLNKENYLLQNTRNDEKYLK